MKKKILCLFIALFFMLSFVFIGCGTSGRVSVMAEETSEIVESGEGVEEEQTLVSDGITPSENGENDDGAEDNEIVEAFIKYLKEEYGDEYETYYNAIIEQWGSVKAYLNSKIEDGTLTESADNWSLFVAWMDRYSVIWAPILAVLCVILAFIAGRKVYIVIKNLFNRLFKGTNQTATAQIAIIESLEKLLGNTEKTKEEREKLEKAKEELLKDE